MLDINKAFYLVVCYFRYMYGFRTANRQTRSQAVARTADRTASQQHGISDCCQIPYPAVFEILGSKHIAVTRFDLSGSRDVIDHVTI